MDFQKEIEKIIAHSQYQGISTRQGSETAVLLEEFNKSLQKNDKRQMEMSLILEEIYENIQEISETAEENEKDQKISQQMILSMVSLIDVIEDFYILYSKKDDSTFASQTEVLWNTIMKKSSLIGLTRISDEKTPSDIMLNTIVATEWDSTLPSGYIIRTLRSGYLYNNMVIRKSEVIVNKPE